MAAPMKAGLPPDCELAAGFQVQLLALDASGNPVANVQLSEVAFFVTDIGTGGGATGPDDTPLPLLVPSDELV